MKKGVMGLLAVLGLIGMVACSNQTARKEEVKTSTSQATTSSSEVKTSDSSNKEVKKEVQPMQIEAIANGDYSSIVGVWQDDRGNKLVFNNQGLVSQEYETYGASLTDYGTAAAGFYGGRDGGFLMEFIPAGVVIGDQVDAQGQVVFTDSSDSTKNRLWTGVGMYSFAEQGSFYYRVGDE